MDVYISNKNYFLLEILNPSKNWEGIVLMNEI